MPSDTPPQSLPLEIGDDCIDAVHVHVIPARLTLCPYAEYRLSLSRPLARHHIRYNALYINDLHLMTRRQRPVVPCERRQELTEGQEVPVTRVLERTGGGGRLRSQDER